MNSKQNPDAYHAFLELTEEEWKELFSDLLAYTIGLVRKKYWRHDLLPKGLAEEDIVQRLVIKTINGERNWDPSKIDLRTFLFTQIKSLVSHLFEYKEYKHETHVDETEDDLLEVIDREMLASPDNESPYTMSPEDALLAKEKRDKDKLDAKKTIDALIEECSEDPELEEVLYAVEELLGRGQSAGKHDLAEYLGVPREDIYNRVKRLRRRVQKVEEKRMQEGES